MTATIIDGKEFAAQLCRKVARQVEKIKSEQGEVPGLAVVLVGEDPASQVYVRSKGKKTHQVGMNSFEHRLSVDTDEHSLLTLIQQLNDDPSVHGILCQLPLPDHLDEKLIIDAINPDKDVDGFHLINVGRLSTNQDAMVPCTPLGCLMLLDAHYDSLSGKEAVVIGRSNIVGKPMAQLLVNAGCTLTIAHSRTNNIAEVVKRADIVVVAVGKAQLVKASWIKPGAVVIDVGINRMEIDGKSILIGDVDFDNVKNVASAITPVPGGVGPMTIACLLANTVTAYCRAKQLPEPPELTL